MTMSFDDWFKEKDPFGGNNDNDYVIWAKKFMRISYIAGQESHQAEVDELLLVGNNLLDRIQELCCERDELQNRIGDLEQNEKCVKNLVNDLSNAKSKLNKIAIRAQEELYTFGAALRFKDAVQNILKGNKND